MCSMWWIPQDVSWLSTQLSHRSVGLRTIWLLLFTHTCTQAAGRSHRRIDFLTNIAHSVLYKFKVSAFVPVVPHLHTLRAEHRLWVFYSWRTENVSFASSVIVTTSQLLQPRAATKSRLLRVDKLASALLHTPRCSLSHLRSDSSWRLG